MQLYAFSRRYSDLLDVLVLLACLPFLLACTLYIDLFLVDWLVHVFLLAVHLFLLGRAFLFTHWLVWFLLALCTLVCRMLLDIQVIKEVLLD